MTWRDDLDKHAGLWGFYKLEENEVTGLDLDFSNAKIRPNANNWPEMHCKVRVEADEEYQDARLEFWSLSAVKRLTDGWPEKDVFSVIAVRTTQKRDGKKINEVEFRC